MKWSCICEKIGTNELYEKIGFQSKKRQAAPVEKLPEAINLDKPADAEHGLELEAQVEKVEGEEAEEVDVEGGRVHVVLPQLH